MENWEDLSPQERRDEKRRSHDEKIAWDSAYNDMRNHDVAQAIEESQAEQVDQRSYFDPAGDTIDVVESIKKPSVWRNINNVDWTSVVEFALSEGSIFKKHTFPVMDVDGKELQNEDYPVKVTRAVKDPGKTKVKPNKSIYARDAETRFMRFGPSSRARFLNQFIDPEQKKLTIRGRKEILLFERESAYRLNNSESKLFKNLVTQATEESLRAVLTNLDDDYDSLNGMYRENKRALVNMDGDGEDFKNELAMHIDYVVGFVFPESVSPYLENVKATHVMNNMNTPSTYFFKELQKYMKRSIGKVTRGNMYDVAFDAVLAKQFQVLSDISLQQDFYKKKLDVALSKAKKNKHVWNGIDASERLEAANKILKSFNVGGKLKNYFFDFDMVQKTGFKSVEVAGNDQQERKTNIIYLASKDLESVGNVYEAIYHHLVPEGFEENKDLFAIVHKDYALGDGVDTENIMRSYLSGVDLHQFVKSDSKGPKEKTQKPKDPEQKKPEVIELDLKEREEPRGDQRDEGGFLGKAKKLWKKLFIFTALSTGVTSAFSSTPQQIALPSGDGVHANANLVKMVEEYASSPRQHSTAFVQTHTASRQI